MSAFDRLSLSSLLLVTLMTVSLFCEPAASMVLSFSDCGANEVKAIRSSSCQADPCRVPLGGQVDVEVDFVPKNDAKKVSIAVFASVFGFEVALPLDDTDACTDNRLTCPVITGKHHTLRYSLKVKETYYPVSGDVGFKLLSDSGEQLACATITAELYDKSHEEL